MPSPKDIPIKEVAKTRREKGIRYFVHHLTNPYEVAEVTEPVSITAREHNHDPFETVIDMPRPGALYSSANQVGFANTEAAGFELYEEFCMNMIPGDEVRLYRIEDEKFNYTKVRPLLPAETLLGEEHGCTLIEKQNWRGFERFTPEQQVELLLSNIQESNAKKLYASDPYGMGQMVYSHELPDEEPAPAS